MKKDLSPLEVVTEINYKISDKQYKDNPVYYNNNYVFLLEYLTDGFVEVIKFEKFVLWDSENDERDWLDNDNKEPLLPFIKKKLNKHIDKIKKLKIR
jgi:hypothetical protein